MPNQLSKLPGIMVLATVLMLLGAIAHYSPGVLSKPFFYIFGGGLLVVTCVVCIPSIKLSLIGLLGGVEERSVVRRRAAGFVLVFALAAVSATYRFITGAVSGIAVVVYGRRSQWVSNSNESSISYYIAMTLIAAIAIGSAWLALRALKIARNPGNPRERNAYRALAILPTQGIVRYAVAYTSSVVVFALLFLYVLR